MEVPQQLPPQKQLIVTTQSVNKTLLTTKEVLRLPIEMQRLPIRMDRLEKTLESCSRKCKKIESCNKKITRLETDYAALLEELDDATTVCSNIIGILEKNGLIKQKKIKLNDNIQDGINQLATGILDQSSSDDETSEDSSDDKPLTIQEKFEQLEEKIESFKYFVREALKPDDLAKDLQSITIVGIQEEVSELTDGIEALKKQINSLNTNPETVKTELATFQEKYAEDQEKLLQSNGKKNAYLESIIQKQSEEISTLRRWLIAMGGGSACALALFIWHYTHSK